MGILSNYLNLEDVITVFQLVNLYLRTSFKIGDFGIIKYQSLLVQVAGKHSTSSIPSQGPWVCCWSTQFT